MRPIHLHDTRTGEVLPLRPRDPGRVGIYACGPTVYSRIHVGNARPFVIFSLLARFLEHEGYGVKLVMNITDVNDKIYDAARAQHRPSAELAEEMTARYREDTDALELGRPNEEPLASETMGPIVAYIEALIQRGHAYESDGDVFFRVRSDPDYGSLSHRRLEDMDQGEPVEGADRKQDPLDFALWKARKEGEDTFWPSPWGPGRPGWHIECSAMAEHNLRVGFDIHGGGSDLLFPHHENEAAQTRAARGEELDADLDAQRHDPVHRGEDGQVGGQHRAAARGRGAVRTRRCRHVPRFAGTTVSPWRFQRRRSTQATAQRQSHSRGGAPAVRRRFRQRPRRSCRTASSRRWPTTSTPQKRLPASTNGFARRRTPRLRPKATPTCARCLASRGWRACRPGTGDEAPSRGGDLGGPA